MYKLLSRLPVKCRKCLEKKLSESIVTGEHGEFQGLSYSYTCDLECGMYSLSEDQLEQTAHEYCRLLELGDVNE